MDCLEYFSYHSEISGFPTTQYETEPESILPCSDHEEDPDPRDTIQSTTAFAEEMPTNSQDISMHRDDMEFPLMIVKTESLVGQAALQFAEAPGTDEHMEIQLDPSDIYSLDYMGEDDPAVEEATGNRPTIITLSSPIAAPTYFQCNQCTAMSASEEGMKFHVKMIHEKTIILPKNGVLTNTGTRTYYCKECNFKTNQHNLLKGHVDTHYRDKPLKCEQCHFQTRYYAVLKKHKELHITAAICQCKNAQRHGQILHCPFCMFFTVCPESLQIHRAWHEKRNKRVTGSVGTVPPPPTPAPSVNEPSLQCTSCNFLAPNEEQLQIHVIAFHAPGGVRTFLACEDCNYTTNDGEKFKKHALEHYKRKRIKCEDCEYACDNQSYMTKHKRLHLGANICQCLGVPIHNGYVYCNQCMFFTICPTSLISHESWHSSKRSFKCDLCPFTAISGRSLKKHVDIHHKNDLSKHRLQAIASKPFSCVLCNFTAPANFLLKLHVESCHWYTAHKNSGASSSSSANIGGGEQPVDGVINGRTVKLPSPHSKPAVERPSTTRSVPSIKLKPCFVLLKRLTNS